MLVCVHDDSMHVTDGCVILIFQGVRASVSHVSNAQSSVHLSGAASPAEVLCGGGTHSDQANRGGDRGAPGGHQSRLQTCPGMFGLDRLPAGMDRFLSLSYFCVAPVEYREILPPRLGTLSFKWVVFMLRP